MIRNQLQGESVLIVAGGPSVNDHSVTDMLTYPTIGVNQICRRFDPDWVTLLDTPVHWGEGMEWGMKALVRARTVMTHENWPHWEKKVPRGKENRVNKTLIDFSIQADWCDWVEEDYRVAVGDWDEGEIIHVPYGPTSAGVACWLAAFMGARRVGLIGVDMGQDYFFESWKPQAVKNKHEDRLIKDWGCLGEFVNNLTGTEIYNLSDRSKVDTLPKASLTAWLLEDDLW